MPDIRLRTHSSISAEKETIERVFADAKEKHAMRYTQYRGLAQVTNWVKLKFVAMNLKKLATWKWRDLLSLFRFAVFFAHICSRPSLLLSADRVPRQTEAGQKCPAFFLFYEEEKMMEIYGTIQFRFILPHIPGFQQEPLPEPVCSHSRIARTAPIPCHGFSLLGRGRNLPAEPNERDQREEGGQRS